MTGNVNVNLIQAVLLAFAATVSVLAGITAGILPALRATAVSARSGTMEG